MENTVTPIISASAIEGITTDLTAQVSAVAPQLLGLVAVPLAIFLIVKLVKRFAK